MNTTMIKKIAGNALVGVCGIAIVNCGRAQMIQHEEDEQSKALNLWNGIAESAIGSMITITTVCNIIDAVRK